MNNLLSDNPFGDDDDDPFSQPFSQEPPEPFPENKKFQVALSPRSPRTNDTFPLSPRAMPQTSPRGLNPRSPRQQQNSNFLANNNRNNPQPSPTQSPRGPTNNSDYNNSNFNTDEDSEDTIYFNQILEEERKIFQQEKQKASNVQNFDDDIFNTNVANRYYFYYYYLFLFLLLLRYFILI